MAGATRLLRRQIGAGATARHSKRLCVSDRRARTADRNGHRMSRADRGYGRRVHGQDPDRRPQDEVRNAPGGKLEGLTGTRAVAAMWVVGFHCWINSFRQIGADLHVLPVLGYGYLGVDLFFVLSGFVIWHVHGDDLAWPHPVVLKRFLALRLARLYPVHLVALIALVMLLWLLPSLAGRGIDHRIAGIPALFRHLALVQAWGFSRTLSWNYPDWSISAEWLSYLCFPLVACAISRLRGKGTFATSVVLFLAVVVLCVGPFQGSMNQSVGPDAVVRAVPEFILGCLLRRGWHRIRSRPVWWNLWALAVSALILAAAAGGAWTDAIAVVGFPFLILAASVPGNIVSWTLGHPALVRIGEASYALYLMQAPVEYATAPLRRHLSPDAPVHAALALLGYVGLLALSTWLVHRFVEVPSRRRLRSLIDGKGRTTAADPCAGPRQRGDGATPIGRTWGNEGASSPGGRLV